MLSCESENGLIQVPFNAYQDVKLKSARYFKINSLGEKVLVENVKVRHADTRDYFIEDIFYHDLKVKQFRSSVPLAENYIVTYSYDIIYKDLKFLNSIYFQNAKEAVDKFKITIHKNPNVDFSAYEFNLQQKCVKIRRREKNRVSCKFADEI